MAACRDSRIKGEVTEKASPRFFEFCYAKFSTLRCTEKCTCVLSSTLRHGASPAASGNFLPQSLQDSRSVSWGGSEQENKSSGVSYAPTQATGLDRMPSGHYWATSERCRGVIVLHLSLSPFLPPSHFLSLLSPCVFVYSVIKLLSIFCLFG